MATQATDTTLMGFNIRAIRGVPPCVVWFDQLGLMRVRLLTTDREFVRIGDEWKEWPPDAPPDAATGE
jgi:hypothetical protein